MYIIVKDGLYLMEVRNLGIREVNAQGVFADVQTGIYTADRRDAKVFESGYLAQVLGAVAVRIDAKEPLPP